MLLLHLTSQPKTCLSPIDSGDHQPSWSSWQTDKQEGPQTDRQKDWWTGRQVGRQAARQISYIHSSAEMRGYRRTNMVSQVTLCFSFPKEHVSCHWVNQRKKVIYINNTCATFQIKDINLHSIGFATLYCLCDEQEVETGEGKRFVTRGGFQHLIPDECNIV